MMTIKVRLTFTDGWRSWSVPGVEVPFDSLTVADLTDRVGEAEEYLSRVTGLKVRIVADVGERKHT